MTSTKIELEEPFKSLWRLGYLVTNKEPRRNVILFNSHKDRTTISYARYLMSVHLGEFLDESLVVDHVNGDKLDDRIENYQLLTVAENNLKRFQQNAATRAMVEMKCGACGCIFTKPKNQSHLIIKNKNTDYCSKECGYKSKYLKEKSEVLREYRE